MDIFSRKIVGWQVYEAESSELASEVLRDICARENIPPNQVVLHSDGKFIERRLGEHGWLCVCQPVAELRFGLHPQNQPALKDSTNERINESAYSFSWASRVALGPN